MADLPDSSLIKTSADLAGLQQLTYGGGYVSAREFVVEARDLRVSAERFAAALERLSAPRDLLLDQAAKAFFPPF